MEDSEQRYHEITVKTCIKSFFKYREYAMNRYYTPHLRKWNSLNRYQQSLIEWFPSYLVEMKKCIDANSVFLVTVSQFCSADWISSIDDLQEEMSLWKDPTELDMNNTVSMLSQVAREWSEECSPERQFLNHEVNNVIKDYFMSIEEKSSINILNPGCGTGRFVADMNLEGYTCTGIENSFPMIMVSMYILNSGIPKHAHTIYPYIHKFSHNQNRKQQLKGVQVPSFNIIETLPIDGEMSIGYGSFVNCFGPNENIQCSSEYSITPDMVTERAGTENSQTLIVTNFFIDTATNILNYLQAIQHSLKPGGIWVNFGPLLYHFEGNENEETVYDYNIFTGSKLNEDKSAPLQGLELSAEDIISVATRKLGFTLLEYKSNISSGYGSTNSDQDIPGLGYQCNFWVLRLQY